MFRIRVGRFEIVFHRQIVDPPAQHIDGPLQARRLYAHAGQLFGGGGRPPLPWFARPSAGGAGSDLRHPAWQVRSFRGGREHIHPADKNQQGQREGQKKIAILIVHGRGVPINAALAPGSTERGAQRSSGFPRKCGVTFCSERIILPGLPGAQRPRKSNNSGSGICEGRTFSSARNILLRRPGVRFSHSFSSALDLHALQAVLRAAQITGNNRIIHGPGEPVAIFLCDEGQRAVDEQIAFLVHQLGRHRGHAPHPWNKFMKKVSSRSSRWWPSTTAEHPSFARDPIQVAAPQPRAQRAIGCAPPAPCPSRWNRCSWYSICGAAPACASETPATRSPGNRAGLGPDLQASKFNRQQPAPLKLHRGPRAACSCPCPPTGRPASARPALSCRIGQLPRGFRG